MKMAVDGYMRTSFCKRRVADPRPTVTRHPAEPTAEPPNELAAAQPRLTRGFRTGRAI
jgi:hypothetical protein